MEEDVEIELLLKSNGQILQEAARLPKHGTFSEYEETNCEQENYLRTEEVIELRNLKSSSDINKNTTTETNISPEKNKSSIETSFCSKNTICPRKPEISYGEEVQELLDDHLVSYMAKKPTKHFLPLHAIDSDEESTDSEYTHYGNNEEDYFINEIMADDEPRGIIGEQIQIQVGIKSKLQLRSNIINELFPVQRLILERDNLLTKLEIRLQQELHDNKEKQRKIELSLQNLTVPDSSKNREPSFTRCFFKKFGMPYFEDSRGFTAPPNEDHYKKIKRGELMVTTIPKVHYWTKSHKDILQEAIRQTLISENSVKISKEIEKLNRSLDTPSIDKNEVLKTIGERQDKLRFLKTLSFSELVIKEDKDREYDWMKYSAVEFNENHSADECQRFWHVYLKPSINKSSWEMHEDLKLLEIAEQMQYQDWDAIAKLLNTCRTAYQCLVHFQTRIHTKHNYYSGKWTEEEDKKLLSVINASKIGDFIPWTKVSTHMGNRTHNQIYNRWSNSLNPKLVKGKFTKEEDLLIVSGIEVFGVTYKEMSSLMTNRSCSQIRDRYERYLIPKTAKVGSWSLDEDEKLLLLIQKHGEQNWAAISEEMKTRSRTQVRQRYSFIQLMTKTKPGWSIAQVKRREFNDISIPIKKATKNVEKVKKEIEQVDNFFKLSQLERETFKIEKLKELRDKVLLKKCELKRKHKVYSDGSEVNNLLLEYFKSYQPRSQTSSTKIHNQNDYNAYLNEILLMAKYFGHELKLPEFEDEITENSRLSFSLKHFLRETINKRVVGSMEISSENLSNSMINFDWGNNIDYVEPEYEDDMLMKEWWHTPPVNVTNLNFSEFLKRTVFDYSYGMHKDIWTSKKNRSSTINLNILGDVAESEHSVLRQQQFHIPPNHLTTLGLKSLLLSRARLKRNASEKEDNPVPKPETDNVLFSLFKTDCEENYNLIDQFQETMLTLFTWPKVLSLTNIESTSVVNPTQVTQQKTHNRNYTDNLLSNHQISVTTNTTRLAKMNNRRQKIRQSILEQTGDRKRELMEFQKGIRYKRKMKIEHLLKTIKTEDKCKFPLNSKVYKRKIKYKIDTWKKNINKSTTTIKSAEPSRLLAPRTIYQINQQTNERDASYKSYNPPAKKVRYANLSNGDSFYENIPEEPTTITDEAHKSAANHCDKRDILNHSTHLNEFESCLAIVPSRKSNIHMGSDEPEFCLEIIPQTNESFSLEPSKPVAKNGNVQTRGAETFKTLDLSKDMLGNIQSVEHSREPHTLFKKAFYYQDKKEKSNMQVGLFRVSCNEDVSGLQQLVSNQTFEPVAKKGRYQTRKVKLIKDKKEKSNMQVGLFRVSCNENVSGLQQLVPNKTFEPVAKKGRYQTGKAKLINSSSKVDIPSKVHVSVSNKTCTPEASKGPSKNEEVADKLDPSQVKHCVDVVPLR